MIRRTVLVGSASIAAFIGSTLVLGWDQSAPTKPGSPAFPEAPAAFDNKSNGMVDDPSHLADQGKFDEVENVADGLGPLYNAQSCRECHQNPTSGGGSQVTELRVGHLGPDHRFVNPNIPIARGTEIISGRTLVNDRAICPNAVFPDTEIQERAPESETVRTTRISLSLFGDGFVEAVADQTLIELAKDECKSTHGKVCGVVIYVPIVEAPGQSGVGRFGWKDQHASLLSFSADAYLNEMGITTALFPDEVTKLCNTASEPNDTPGPDGLADIDHFARFIRAAKAPPRDVTLAATPAATKGSGLFDKTGCAVCHVRTLSTAPPAQRSMVAHLPSRPRWEAKHFILSATSCSTMWGQVMELSFPRRNITDAQLARCRRSVRPKTSRRLETEYAPRPCGACGFAPG
jgi:mono/diheme cytochrome c family protein